MENNIKKPNILIRMLQYFPVVFLRIIGSNKVTSLIQDAEIEEIPELKKKISSLQTELRGAMVVIHVLTSRQSGGKAVISTNDIESVKQTTQLFNRLDELGNFEYTVKPIEKNTKK